MLVTDMFVALMIALLLSGTFAGLARATTPGAGVASITAMLAFFVLVFLASWAGGLWVRPIGPTIWGVAWVSFLMVGLLVALVFVAALPRRRSTRNNAAPASVRAYSDAEAVGLGLFFWIAALLLALAVIFAYR